MTLKQWFSNILVHPTQKRPFYGPPTNHPPTMTKWVQDWAEGGAFGLRVEKEKGAGSQWGCVIWEKGRVQEHSGGVGCWPEEVHGRVMWVHGLGMRGTFIRLQSSCCSRHCPSLFPLVVILANGSSKESLQVSSFLCCCSLPLSQLGKGGVEEYTVTSLP